LRNRWRDLIRNNGFATRIQETIVNGLVGTGHVPRPQCMIPGSIGAGQPVLDREANAKVLSLWKEFARDCDAESDLDFDGFQSLAAHTWKSGGDVLVRRRRRKATDGFRVPMQLQMLEGDYLDDGKDGTTAPNGNRIVLGKEYNKIGKLVAFWMFQRHPGDSGYFPGDTGASVRVPADGVAHLYSARRAGQVRGVPVGAPIADDLRQLDQIEAAAATKLRTESCITGIVQYEDVNDANLAGWSLAEDGSGKAVDRIGVGMMIPMPHSKNVTFTQPTATSNADALMNRQQHEIASGVGISYEQMTGDLSGTNFAGSRIGLMPFREATRISRAQEFRPLFLDRVWGWFIEMAILAGELEDREGGYPVLWQAPAFEAVDVQQAATANEIKLRSGQTSFSIIAAEQGLDPADLMAQIAADKALAESFGLTFTWMQPQPGAAAPDPVQQSQAGSTPPNGVEVPTA
jgi:lambda family phage portal protein